MSGQIQAEILSIGTELLTGETMDTNSSFMSGELLLMGISLRKVTVMPDDRAVLCGVLRQALENADVIIASGGLGPTEDDLTRESVAEVLGEEMRVDAGLERHLRELFERMGREMPPHNIKQAMLIPSAEALHNPNGTAPGWWAKKNGRLVVLLPGPPRELKYLWFNEVKPRLAVEFPAERIETLTLKIYGLPEATVAEKVTAFFESDNPALGIYARPDGIHLRLIAHGQESSLLLERAEQELREIFAHHIWGRNDDDLPQVTGRLLAEKEKTVATLEDGSRGLLANTFSGTDCLVGWYGGGAVTCSESAMVREGVPAEVIRENGKISAAVAEAMARAARERYGVDIGLSTTGIVGIDLVDNRASGLAYIGYADANGRQSWQHSFPAYRDVARSRLAVAALFRLRRCLLGD